MKKAQRNIFTKISRQIQYRQIIKLRAKHEFNSFYGSVALRAMYRNLDLVSVVEYVIHFPAFVDSALVSDFTGGAIYNLFKQYNPVELLLSF